MGVLDRYIARRFLSNFAVLLALLFSFAISIDLILQLDEFVEAAEKWVGADAGLPRKISAVALITLNFHGPRIFQFYAYMLGLLTVGAMAFTLAQMHRARELVAVLASGVRLHRVALPILGVAAGLNLLQLLNQELVLPRLAPLLIRSHSSLGRQSVVAFEIPFTSDGRGNIFQAPSFDPDPHVQTLIAPTILERDAAGRTTRRITARSARWDRDEGAWHLVDGHAIVPRAPGELRTRDMLVGEAVETYRTDLTPEVLTLRRYRQYATMLSVAQIRRMLDTPGVVDNDTLARFLFGRVSTVMINMLLLVMTLPFFLLREPADLVRKSIVCSGVAIPVMLGALLGVTVELPGVPVALAVFLPGLVLIPVAMFMVGLIRT
jgi:lipopolysaccharide export LptBFGC system permease protein LptF